MVQRTGDWALARRVLTAAPLRLKRAIGIAVRQEAHALRNAVVQGLTNQAPGGEPIRPPSALTIAARELKGFGGTKALIVRGDLRNSLGVVVRDDEAFVGVLRSAKSSSGGSAANLAELHEFGGPPVVIPITPKYALSTLWYANLEASFFATHDETSWTLSYFTHDSEEASHNTRYMVGVPLRAGLGLGQGLLGVELGVVLGAAWRSVESDICSDSAGLVPMLGGYIGPILRFDPGVPLRLAAQIQSVSPIMPRCTNVGTPEPPNDYAPEWFFDSPPDPTILTQVGIGW